MILISSTTILDFP